MTTYNTSTLTAAIMGEEAVETAAKKKANTRTIRKFLRDELGGGKAVVGKGSRYTLDYNKRELTALTKKFKAWEVAQEEAKQARREALEAAKTPKVEETVPEAEEATESDIEDDSDEAPEGPTDDEIAQMLADEDELVDEA